MIHFQRGNVSSLNALEGCMTLSSLGSLVSEIRKSLPPDIVGMHFGACYEFPDGRHMWSRMTYLVGTNRRGSCVTLGVCDYRPANFGQVIF